MHAKRASPSRMNIHTRLPHPETALAPSLRALLLDGNRLSCLGPLAALSRLEELSVARNRLHTLHGLAALGALRRLGAADNMIGRLEDVGAVTGLRLLGDLDLRGNPLEQVGGVNHLVPGVCFRAGNPQATIPPPPAC